MEAALLAALADGAGASPWALAEAVGRPDLREVVREWGERLARLLAADPRGAGAARRRLHPRQHSHRTAEVRTRAEEVE
jgi:hypothetical protein